MATAATTAVYNGECGIHWNLCAGALHRHGPEKGLRLRAPCEDLRPQVSHCCLQLELHRTILLLKGHHAIGTNQQTHHDPMANHSLHFSGLDCFQA